MTVACPHPSSTGWSPETGPSTLTCRSCGETWATSDPDATYELEVNLMRTKVDFTVWRSWTGRRWLNGEPYDGPVYAYLSPNVSQKARVS
jgi:hypothetical protein